MSGSALEGGAVFEGEGQAAICVGRGVVQQTAPELFVEGGDLAVPLFQNPEEVLHRAAPVPHHGAWQCVKREDECNADIFGIVDS